MECSAQDASASRFGGGLQLGCDIIWVVEPCAVAAVEIDEQMAAYGLH